MEDFPSRDSLKKQLGDMGTQHMGYQSSLVKELQEIIKESNPEEWKDSPYIKMNQVEKQKEYFWIRIYLEEEDDLLKVGDQITMTHVPTNEQIEMIFGAYEKEGLNRDFDDEVVNYVSESDKKILCCMIDVERVNKDSEDIPTLRTFFRISRFYQENLFLKSDLTITKDDHSYKYTSISF